MTTKQKIDHTARLNEQIADKLQSIVDALDSGASASDFEMPFKSTGCRPYNPCYRPCRYRNQRPDLYDDGSHVLQHLRWLAEARLSGDRKSPDVSGAP